MNITVTREQSRNGFTPGELTWDTPDGPQHECYTVEDEVREITGVPVEQWKIAGKTAIQEGRYRLVIDLSKRFERLMPHVLEVPGFTGVRLHVANTAADVEGCAGLGRTQTSTGVGESRLAFNAFFPKLEAALRAGDVWITYRSRQALVT